MDSLLLKSRKSQIHTLSQEFETILQTLELHDDKDLWRYVYQFIYNAALSFKFIQQFIGTKAAIPPNFEYNIHYIPPTISNENSRLQSLFYFLFFLIFLFFLKIFL